VRFAGLGDQSLWYDEALTLRTVEGSAGNMWDLIEEQAVPPLYFALAWVWTRVFGEGEAGVRSLSAVFGALTVPVAYAAGAELVSRRAGLLAAALVALSPPLVYYSQEARSYSLTIFLCAVSLAFFARARQRSSPRDLAGWAIASGLALSAHYFAAFVVIPEAVLLLAGSRTRATLAAVAGVGAAGLALLPLALYQSEHGGPGWIANFDLGTRVREAVRVFATGTTVPPQRLASVVVLAGLVLLALALLRGGAERRRGALVALGVGTSALVLPLALAAVGSDYVLDRNLLVAWVPLAVALAAGIDAAVAGLAGPGRRVAAAGIAASLVLVAAFALQIATLPGDEDRRRDDWRALARSLGPNERPRVIAVTPYWQSAAFERYMPGMGAMPGPRTVSEVVVVSYGGVLPTGDAKAAVRPPAPFRQVGAYRVHRMSVARFRAPRPTVLAASSLYVPGRNGALPYYQRAR
jgi:4-amino-4-deoxy-L-arabinose transferase-like glycosyltransferase